MLDKLRNFEFENLDLFHASDIKKEVDEIINILEALNPLNIFYDEIDFNVISNFLNIIPSRIQELESFYIINIDGLF